MDIQALLDLADEQVEVSRQVEKRKTTLRGRTQINLFFEPSTRTQSSFEIAGKRLGADVMNMSVASSSVKKGETLIDTAATLNAMRPDIIVVRHHAAGAVHLLAQKVDCSVVNAGDGTHEHPTQALLDALTIRRNKGRIDEAGVFEENCSGAHRASHRFGKWLARASSTAMRTATPISTCSRMSDCAPSATSEEISTPRFMGPGCITSASGLAKESFSWSSP